MKFTKLVLLITSLFLASSGENVFSTFKSETNANDTPLAFESEKIDKEEINNESKTIYDDKQGFNFTTLDIYKMKNINECPLTYEVKIKVDRNAADGILGTIVGNYNNDSNYVNFEIRENGNLAVRSKSTKGVGTTAQFTKFDIRQNKILNVAVTCDLDSSAFKLYVDGELIKTVTKTFPKESFTKPMVIGSDFATDNANYLKYSTIYSVSLFNSVRTQDQIISDFESLNYSDSSLIAAYDLTSNNSLSDLSTNKNDLEFQTGVDYHSKADTDSQGMFFKDDEAYQPDAILDTQVQTWEAYVKVPYGYAYDPGSIIGSAKGLKGGWALSIEIGGHPRLAMQYPDLRRIKCLFDKVDVRKPGNKWTHIAISNYALKNEVRCYMDGELVQTLTGALEDTINEFGVVLGGDQDNEQRNRYKCKVSDISLFKTRRTDEQIKEDLYSIDNSNEDLLVHYELTGKQGSKEIENLANDKYTVELQDDWYGEEDKTHVIEDYAGAVAVVGDIQRLSCYTPDYLHYIYDWLVNNKAEKDIRYVLTTGDNTDKNTSEEWTRVRQQYARLDSIGLEYAINQGNHDGAEGVKSTFTDTTYRATVDGFYDSSDIRNSYRYLTIGEAKFIIFTLQVDPTPGLMAWVNDVLSANEDCIAIMTLHIFMDIDYTLVHNETSYAPADSGKIHNGTDYWTKVFRKHSNIGLVICGHEHSEDLLVRKMVGDNGNIVTILLVDPQEMDKNYASTGGTGMVCMLYFSEDGKSIQTEWISSIKNQYHRQINQTTIKLFE